MNSVCSLRRGCQDLWTDRSPSNRPELVSVRKSRSPRALLRGDASAIPDSLELAGPNSRPTTEVCHEAVFRARCVFPLSAYRVAGDWHAVRTGAGRQQRKEDQIRQGFLAGQSEGAGAGAGARQRREADRRTDHCSVYRRPKAGIMERYRVHEWQNFITSELHKSFGPIFRPNTPDAYKKISKENIGKRFDYLDNHLAGRQYLTGDKFTIADAYLYTVTRWLDRVGMDVSKWPNVKAYADRVTARPK